MALLFTTRQMPKCLISCFVCDSRHPKPQRYESRARHPNPQRCESRAKYHVISRGGGVGRGGGVEGNVGHVQSQVFVENTSPTSPSSGIVNVPIHLEK